jgi:diguanylate cyclase (GGDEF)-like protein/PAS domain S-box-containing protein
MKFLQKLKDSSGGRRLLLGLLLIILVAGALGVWWLVVRADREMREDQIAQTRLVAAAVNLERIKAITGTETDLESPEYLRLKDQLTLIRAADAQCRFVYLMGRKADGSVFFFMDSEPADSKDYSPPGQAYEDSPESFRRIFDTGAPLAEGPYSDQWGTWLSVLVPLTDPQSGAVLAVMGMDIDARDWQMNVAAQAALPVGLVLLLMIGLLTVLFAGVRVSASPKPVLRRLLPFLAIMLLTLIISTVALMWQQHSERISENTVTMSDEVTQDLKKTLEQQARGLTATAQYIALDPRVREAMSAEDTERLLADWQGLFETLHREKSLTSFTFIDVNHVGLLRVHKPEMRGDKIELFTVLEAERTGKPAWGIELSPMGTFTLRAVQPVFDGQRLVGYIGLGKEIEDVWQSLNENKEIQIAFSIKKDMLKRETWESGMSMHGREADWERLPHSVIIYASQGRLPDAFAQLADRDPLADNLGTTDQDIADSGRDWRVTVSPLTDASGKEVGDLLVMVDITDMNTVLARSIIIEGIAGVLVLAMLLGLTSVMLRRTDASIRAQRTKLVESEEHLSATLRSIGDGVIACDVAGSVVNLNTVAEALTGWTFAEAVGKHVNEVFCIVNAQTREPADNPVFRAIREGLSVELANHTALISRNGTERQIADSCAPIRDIFGAVTGAVLVFRDVTEEYRQREEIKHLSFHDHLTGLFNRRLYEAELTRLDTERNWPLTIVMGDVNGLKLVNDTFGHTAGDQLLVKAAATIKNSCRADEIVARIGGDEFAILLPKTDGFEAEKLIKRIRGLCEIERIEGLEVSISFGYGTKTSEADDIELILTKAEDMMYHNKLFEGASIRRNLIDSIFNALNSKSEREKNHSRRVSELCERIGIVLGLEDYMIKEMGTLGLLHDIGKIAVSDTTLNKPGSLTEDEWIEMKSHAEIGYRILSTNNDTAKIAEYVLAHHERWDGKGYPKGLKGVGIPLQARIIAVADAYDAMTEDRHYRRAIGKLEAIKELEINAGTQFDPQIVTAFVNKVLYKE